MSSNLSRVTAKIFAGDAPLSAVGQFGSALNGTKVNTVDIATIQNLSAYTQGWSSAVVTNRNYPTLEEMNGVMKTMSYQTAYSMQKGVPEWDEGTTYFSGDICKGVGTGILYVSRSDYNIGNPVIDGTYWREYQGSASSIPATNYISEINGSATYSNNTVTLPDMTLYIPNGRSGNGSLDNIAENVPSGTYEVSGNGDYTLFYNNTDKNLLLSANYKTRLEELPAGGNYDDVAYLLDNKMYVVESTNPNYELSQGTEVSTDGVVSNLGTLTPLNVSAIPSLPVFNLDFTTGNDIETVQDLFSLPYAKGEISNNNLNITIKSLSYGVNYFSQVYSGSYTLKNQATIYSYLIDDTTYYTKTPIQTGSTVYENALFETPYGTVTALDNDSITVSNIDTVYDGDFTLVSSGDYYTYTLGSTNYYTSEALANGVSVYTDSTLSDLFGTVISIEGSTVLVQSSQELYSGNYNDTSIGIYTYTLGECTLYSSGVLIPGLTLYTNTDLSIPYGVVETITTQNVVIHSTQSSLGYIAISGTGAVPANNPIYSDINLQTVVATTTGANATFNGKSFNSQVGILTYELSANTNYSGTLSFNGTSYTLILNSLSTSLLSSRLPYAGLTSEIVFGGTNAFLGTINLSGTSIEFCWTWNNCNTTTPDWVVKELCKIGSITLTNNEVTALRLDCAIELVKMSDLDNLKLSGSSSGLEVGDIGMSLYVDETKGLRRYLNGQILAINTNTQAFLDKLKKITALNPTLLCSEEEWQAEKTLSKFGQAGRFVFNYAANGTTVESVRLPAVVNIQGLLNLANLGLTLNESLPNLRGEQSVCTPDIGASTGVFFNNGQNSNEGIYPNEAKILNAPVQGNAAGEKFYINANNYSSTYQDNAPVQQEAIQYPYFIQIATSVEEEVKIINEYELNNPFVLLESKYFENPPYNTSWLLSDGQYKSKSLYPAAYNALLIENNPEIEAGQSTTIDGWIYIKRGLSVKSFDDEDIVDYDFVINQKDETFRLPIKTKNAPIDVTQDIPVVGSGNGLGFTNNGVETLYFGTITGSPGAPRWSSDSTLGSDVSQNLNSGVVGLHPNPEKSGAIAKPQNQTASEYKLYFYVGETVQNANLIDAARVLEVLAAKTNMEQAAYAAMPSDRYIDLTLGASGNKYVAPGTGIFYISKAASTNQYITLYNTTSTLASRLTSFNANMNLLVSIQAKKGEEVQINYSATGVTNSFKFIYLEGAIDD